MKWSTALPDWKKRIVRGDSLVPCKPLFPDEAADAMAVFDELKIVDAVGQPTMGEAARPWIRDFAAAFFGALNPETGRRMIREFFLLISKKNGKSTDAAALMLTALIVNWRTSAEFLILAPTKEAADNAFKPAFDMIDADEELKGLLHPSWYDRTIKHRTTGAILKVVAADSGTVTGKKATGVLVDELWLFGKNAKADAMLREATGGIVSRPEGFVIYLSTQSDDAPAGVFKARLNYFRNVRDGKIVDPKSLGVLYEFPDELIENGACLEPDNFYVTNPNIGLSVDQEWLEDEWIKVKDAVDGSKQTFLAKHLNVEIGLALANDAWAGARYWEKAGRQDLRDLDAMLARCEVAVVGIDGGGLDDLLGLCIMGRERETGAWLVWSHAWAHPDVIERRKDIASRLQDFANDGDLTICTDEDPTQDVMDVADYVERVRDAGLLPEHAGVGVDAAGIESIAQELALRGIGGTQVVAVAQGYRLHGTIAGTERRLKDGRLLHGAIGLMAWSVGNAKIEMRGSAMLITKQISGRAKIDPVSALLNAAQLMGRVPEGEGHSVYEDHGILEIDVDYL